MSFSKMIELLQNKEKGKIILVNSGNFYIARGKDAVLLHNVLNLKVNCLETCLLYTSPSPRDRG